MSAARAVYVDDTDAAARGRASARTCYAPGDPTTVPVMDPPPPTTDAHDGPHAPAPDELVQSFDARLLPRNLTDGLVAAVVGIILMALLSGVPAVAAGLATRSFTIGVAVFVVEQWVVARFAVQRLEIRPDGLHFVRHWGTPKAIPWAALRGVRMASRGEVVLHGWFWPPFPSREITPSLTSLGHLRIDYAEGFRFFPPNDERAFVDAIRRYAPWAVVSCRADATARSAARRPAAPT